MSRNTKHSLIVAFEALDDRQFAIVSEVIDALGQHTCGGSFLEVPDATRADLDLIFGLAIDTKRMPADELDERHPVMVAAWREARSRVAAGGASGGKTPGPGQVFLLAVGAANAEDIQVLGGRVLVGPMLCGPMSCGTAAGVRRGQRRNQ
ncbi:MAG: hypothetical protein C3F10_13220 [Dehalococcoidia bacterium]|nr:MAG: hypothetical protein C3F10_13220 [Dehalococcoidia bacterium]